MIQTQQLSPETLSVSLSGRFHSALAKQLALLIFRSHRLGFKTFLFDLNRISFLDARGFHDLALIGQGLQRKGGEWKILGNPPLLENYLLSHEIFENPPRETWN